MIILNIIFVWIGSHLMWATSLRKACPDCSCPAAYRDRHHLRWAKKRSLSLCQVTPLLWPHGPWRLLAIRAIGILLEGSLFGSLWGERFRPATTRAKTSSAKDVKRPSVTLEGKALPKPCLTLRHGKKSRGTSALVSCLEPLQTMKDACYKCPINIDNHFSNSASELCDCWHIDVYFPGCCRKR